MENPFELNFYTSDDVKRVQAALSIKRSNIGLDRINGKAKMQGSSSEPYYVTQTSCTCTDFARRRQPCKHMIRLAIELGADFALPEYDPIAAREYDMSEDIVLLHDRWEAGLITTDAYAACLAALEKSAQKAKK